MQKAKTAGLVWFRNDLRIRDQRALSEATARHERVIGVYHIPDSWMKETPWGFKKMERFRAQFLDKSMSISLVFNNWRM